ncbi:hypothetical protein ACT3CD_10820 [Geofilum sp. OHC36d9]|uniref:hypothetical protein n=1 Tax=Geofilum sp. OHC36d9 TaxID=3458413 RepID=UPI004034C096
MQQFIGYHGTSVASARKIIDNNYELSVGNDEWLGSGVYFFIKGISSKPDEQAKKWAIVQAWNNFEKKYTYNHFSVLRSALKVEDDNLLDLTSEDGIVVLEYLTKAFERAIKKSGKNIIYLDGLLINLARNEGILPVDVVKGNFYIKFARERKKQIRLRTPNCTICTVYDPIKNIEGTKIVKIGDVKNEII